MADERLAYAEVCPHCGKSIAYLRPVSEKTLAAARAILLEECYTSRDVARQLHITVSHAGMLLKRAEAERLISRAKRISRGERGGVMHVYEPAQRLAAYAPLEYKLWKKRQGAITRAS